jgi:hypothetical protein
MRTERKLPLKRSLGAKTFTRATRRLPRRGSRFNFKQVQMVSRFNGNFIDWMRE